MRRFIVAALFALGLVSAAPAQQISTSPPIGLPSASGFFTCTAAGVCTPAIQGGTLEYRAVAVDFTSNTADVATIPITLPTGFTRYYIFSIRIAHASGSLATGTIGIFTGAGGTGVTIVTGASALSITTASENTNNNATTLTLQNATTTTFTAANLFVRTTTGVAQTADVLVLVIPIP